MKITYVCIAHDIMTYVYSGYYLTDDNAFCSENM